MLGAGLALISGVVHVGDIPVVWNIVWNATATFIAVIIISLPLDESGFSNGRHCMFRAGVTVVAVCSLRISFCLVAVAALFANDGAALILTPIVIAMLLALGSAKARHWHSSWLPGLLPIQPACRLSCPTRYRSADFFGLASPSMRR